MSDLSQTFELFENASIPWPGQTDAAVSTALPQLNMLSTQQYREMFEQRLCDLNTSQFLHDSDLVSLLAPVIAKHVETELAALRSQLQHAAPPANWPPKACRIVLCNHEMSVYAGSEMWTFEVAHFLQCHGYSTLVYAPKLGQLAQAMDEAGIAVSAAIDDVLAFAPDLVHLNHFHSAQALLARLPADIPVLNMIHGLLPRPGLPGYAGVRKYCAVSIHAKAKIHLLTSTPWDDILTATNFFDPARFAARPTYPGQRQALLFSSKTLPHHREKLRQILTMSSYSLDHVGYGGQASSQPEMLLPAYDLVLAVGRSAIEALACGCNVMLWDNGIFGPIVNADNFWHGVTSNFALSSSMVPWCDVQAVQAAGLICQLIEQSANAENSTQTMLLARQFLSRDLSCSHLLSCYAQLLHPVKRCC